MAQTQRSERTRIDADWVLTRLADEAEADVADLYDEATGVLKPVHEWPKIWRQGLVAGVEVIEEYETVDGQKQRVGSVRKVRLSERIKRIELIGKHVNVQAFRDQVHNSGAVNGILDWLDREIGRGEYAHNSDSLPGAADCSAYYFRDREAANRFALMMEGRGLVLADPREGGWRRSG